MGQGQSEIALKYLKESCNKKAWVVLCNVHLTLNWLPTLEKELQSLQYHSEFRLILTSEVHAHFPISLAKRCFKVTLESPAGVKVNC